MQSHTYSIEKKKERKELSIFFPSLQTESMDPQTGDCHSVKRLTQLLSQTFRAEIQRHKGGVAYFSRTRKHIFFYSNIATSASYIIRLRFDYLRRKRQDCISHLPFFPSSFASAYSNTDPSDQAMEKINVNLLIRTQQQRKDISEVTGSDCT